MNSQTPPRWAEFLLEQILAEADAPTITGDLREEYAETILPRIGRFRADLWYLRQLGSLSSIGVSQQSHTRGALLLASLFTCACGAWLAFMEWLLRHPGYLLRSAEDVSIALIPLATILVIYLHLGIRAERWLWTGAIALLAIAAQGLTHAARTNHFEGFVVLISLILALQGIFMLLSLGRTRSVSQ